MPRYILKPLRINGPTDTVSVARAHNGEVMIDLNNGDLYYKHHITGDLLKSNQNISGATINNSTIGLTTPAAGKFTNLDVVNNITAGGKISAPLLEGALTGNASSATKLATARNFSITGDGTAAAVAFDGTGNVALTLALANSGATAGTYRSVTVDAKGRVTGGTNPTTLAGYGITDAMQVGGDIDGGTY